MSIERDENRDERESEPTYDVVCVRHPFGWRPRAAFCVGYEAEDFAAELKRQMPRVEIFIWESPSPG